MGKASRKKEQPPKQAPSPQVTTPPHRPTPTEFLTRPLPALFLVLLLASIFNVNVLTNGFNWDDQDIINSLRPADHGWRLFLPDLTVDPASKGVPPYYRPLILASYRLDFMIWGRNPFGFHLSVLLAHLLNTALVFLLAQALVKENALPYTVLPLFAASLFAVHPVHAEAIAWIAGRNDVFCTTFILSSILLYIRFRRTGREWAFGLSMLAFFFALLTKEMAMGLALLYPIYDYLSEPSGSSNPRWQIWIRFPIPLAILGLYFYLRTRNMIHPLGPLSSEEALSPIFTVIGAVGLYLKLLLFPYPQHPFIAAIQTSSAFLVPAGLGLVFFVTGMLYAFIRRNFLIEWGLAWIFVFLTPAVLIAFLPVAAAPAAERYLYAPSIGFLIALGGVMLWGLDQLFIRKKRPARNVWVSMGLLWVVVVFVFGWESWNRNGVWQTSFTFWEAAVAASSGNGPQEAVAHNGLGLEYYNLRRFENAIQEYRTAIKLKPDLVEAHDNLGVAYMDLGRLDEAVEQFQWALKLRPNHAKAHNNLGIAYGQQGRFAEAIQEHLMALKLEPNYVKARYNLGNALTRQGRFDEAVQAYKTALMIQPDFYQGHFNLGQAFAGQGRLEEALAEFETALKLKPDYVKAHLRAGVVYKDLGRIDEAVREFQTVLKLQPDLVEAYYNLGDAYLRKGQTNDAIAALKEALKIKPDFLPAQKALESLTK